MSLSFLDLLIPIIIVGGLAVGFSTFMIDMGNEFGRNTSEIEGLSNIDRTDEIRNRSSKLKGKTSSVSEEQETSWGGFVGSIMKIGNYLFFLPAAAMTVVTSAFKIIPMLPSWFTNMIYALISIVTIFVIISFVFNRRT